MSETQVSFKILIIVFKETLFEINVEALRVLLIMDL